jgi:quinol monooxygenase YgiN
MTVQPNISIAERQTGAQSRLSLRLNLRCGSLKVFDLKFVGFSWTAEQSQRDYDMTTKALFVKLEAKAGKEDEVAKFLRDGQGLVQQEPATTAWFGIRLGPTTFAIFDAFPDDAGRDAHLSGKVAKALMEKAPELLAEPPKIEKADVLADRLLG